MDAGIPMLRRLFQRLLALARHLVPEPVPDKAGEWGDRDDRAGSVKPVAAPISPQTSRPIRQMPPLPRVRGDRATERLIAKMRAATGTQRPLVAKHIRARGPVAVPLLIPLLSDEGWVMRLWAARILGELGDPQALSALQARLPLETDKTVRQALTAAIEVLRLFTLPTVPTAQQLARLPVDLQSRLEELRQDLLKAYQGRDAEYAERLRRKLVKTQVDLCQRLPRSLRHNPGGILGSPRFLCVPL